MSSATPETVPQLNRLFRLQWEPAQNAHVLLYPEGMVQLNGPAAEILTRIDGKQTVAAIISELEQQFPDADGLGDDVLSFMDDAHEQNWITL